MIKPVPAVNVTAVEITSRSQSLHVLLQAMLYLQNQYGAVSRPIESINQFGEFC